MLQIEGSLNNITTNRSTCNRRREVLVKRHFVPLKGIRLKESGVEVVLDELVSNLIIKSTSLSWELLKSGDQGSWWTEFMPMQYILPGLQAHVLHFYA